jgi:hypothetical protein
VLPYAGLAGGIRSIAQYAERPSHRSHEVLIVSTPKLRSTLGHSLISFLKGNGWPCDPVPGPSHLDDVDVSHKIIDRFRPVTDDDVPEADAVIATWWVTARWVANLSASKGAKAYFMQDYGVPGQELGKIIPTWSLPLHIMTISTWMGLAYRRMWSKGTDIALSAVQTARKVVPSLRPMAYRPEQPDKHLPLPANTSYECQATDEEIRQIYAECDAWLFAGRLEGF